MDAKSRARQRLVELAAKVDIDAEARLDDDIGASGARTGGQGAGDVLLTGATGFLGASLLAELVEATDATIVCLVRAGDRATAQRRLFDVVESTTGRPLARSSGIVAVPGDLTRPKLGLADADFEELSGRVGTIFHCGAVVNLLFPYTLLKPANVGGTRELLRLASRGRVKTVHHVSSAGIFLTPAYAGRTVTESDPMNDARGLRYGYGQSKWVAEQLVRQAAGRGIPTAVYRPAFIGWDARSGRYGGKDFVCGLLRSAIETGVAPLADMTLDVVPVDAAVKTIVALAARVEAAGPQTACPTFHVTSPAPAAWPAACEILRSLGCPVTEVPYEAWRAHVEREKDSAFTRLFGSSLSDSADESMLAMLSRRTFPSFDASETRRALGGRVAMPVLDAALLRPYMEWVRRDASMDGAGEARSWHARR